ncbi:MAG: MFS transporter [Propionicimonas sp.]|uniref:MFS transporter n=1 Tax=Propionicimonas sp. TaxID=1955623 RepID=UPI003D12F625
MFLVLLAYLAFFSIALPDSMLGVAWPTMRIDFGQPISAAGLVPPFGVAATLVATSLTGRLLARFGVGRLLAASTLLSTASLVVAATSHSFAQFLASAVLAGLSGGAIDAALNAYAARWFGPRRISLLHASYVLGAAASPLLVTATVQAGLGWRWAWAVVAGVQAVLCGVFLLTRHRWTSGDRPASAGGGAGRGLAGARPLDVGLGLLAVAVQTGIESSVALWAFTALTQSAGVSVVVAGTIASGYWVAIFVGRVVLGWVAERTGPWLVMGGGVVGLLGAAGLGLLGGPVAAPIAIGLFGLAAAPVYPLLTLTTAERTSEAAADTVVGFQAAASSLGAAVFPLLVGIALDRSASGFALAMAGLCIGAALLQAGLQLRRRARRVAGTS